MRKPPPIPKMPEKEPIMAPNPKSTRTSTLCLAMGRYKSRVMSEKPYRLETIYYFKIILPPQLCLFQINNLPRLRHLRESPTTSPSLLPPEPLTLIFILSLNFIP